MLHLRDVTLTYESGGVLTNAVDNVILRVYPGEFIGIIGPSGSGKSSLLYLMAALKTPTSGTIEFLGQDLTRLSKDQRAEIRQRSFGFIFQQHFLIPYLTTIENVLVARPKPDAADVAQARYLLERLGLAAHERKPPHQLSGGQRQRVAVARALLHRPAIIFADEPTASLDHRTGAELMELLGECRREQNAALVVVTHDPSILAEADRTLTMWDGTLTDQAAPQPSLANTRELIVRSPNGIDARQR